MKTISKEFSHQLIAGNKIDQVIDLLINTTTNSKAFQSKQLDYIKYHDQLLSLSGQLFSVTSDRTIGVISRLDKELTVNQIRANLLSLISQLPEDLFLNDCEAHINDKRSKVIRKVNSSKFDYDVYLCFAKENKDQAEILAKKLREFKLRVYFESKQPIIENEFQPEIRNLLDSCQVFVYLLTNDSIKSPGLKKELDYFNNVALKLNNETYIPVIYIEDIDFNKIPNEFNSFQFIYTEEDILEVFLNFQKIIPDEYEEERFLDVAIPENVIVGKETELLLFIRFDKSSHIFELIEERELNSKPHHIKSARFALEFPLNHQGQPIPIDIFIEIETGDFDIAHSGKKIKLSSGKDSPLLIFLLTPKKTGLLNLGINVYFNENHIANGLIKVDSHSKLTQGFNKFKKLLTFPIGSISHSELKQTNEGTEKSKEQITKNNTISVDGNNNFIIQDANGVNIIVVKDLKSLEEIQKLAPNAFSNFIIPPSGQIYGDGGEEIQKVDPVKDINFSFLPDPLSFSIQDIYKLQNPTLFLHNEIYFKYKVWLIYHKISIKILNPNIQVVGFGYEVCFEDKKAYTIDLLPNSKRLSSIGETYRCKSNLSFEGLFLKANSENITTQTDHIDSDYNFEISGGEEHLGGLSIKMLTNSIQTMGYGKPSAEWKFDISRNSGIISQSMFQTVLVPKFSKEIKTKLRGYILFKPNWTDIPSLYQTEWTEIKCSLSSLRTS